MKELKQYKCGICGTVYSDKTKCLECGRQHKLPMNITGTRFLSKKVYAGYPQSVAIKFNDDSIAVYELTSMRK